MKTTILILGTFIIYFHTVFACEYTGSFVLVAKQNYANGNVRSDTISYFFTRDKTAILIHGRNDSPDMRMVFNTADSTITSLFEMKGKKGGFILPMDEAHWPGLPYSHCNNTEGVNAGLNYTGKEKEIMGHTCREVKAESEDYAATFWLAEEIPLSMRRILSYQSVGKGKSREEIELFEKLGINNLPLEMHLRSKEGKADVTILLVNISDTVDSAIFSTEGHTLSRVE